MEQGLRGKPGELKGIFMDDSSLGEIEKILFVVFTEDC
ncbi:hypothetical protein PWK10_08125 [Caloramator sp. Dgby_cultured_2]|nr:hypothetical protein [Caloramator sp. Dgby_cultured_2]WDU84509.1 hypothetical protein PWK10_08125 [Caloramator sp. Dgby_cultured_2]